MTMFLTYDTNFVPDLLLPDVNLPQDLDLDMSLDEQGHAAVHWAAALARIPVLKLLQQKGADISHRNENGETPLMRAVLVTNNFDHQTFPELLELAKTTISNTDNKKRTVLHHIVLAAKSKSRVQACRYYLECLIEFLYHAENRADATPGSSLSKFIDAEDYENNTALNIAARIGNRHLVNQLLEAGANSAIANIHGLKPMDFLSGGLPAAETPTDSEISTVKKNIDTHV
jgi:ankyrin repeat protein